MFPIYKHRIYFLLTKTSFGNNKALNMELKTSKQLSSSLCKQQTKTSGFVFLDPRETKANKLIVYQSSFLEGIVCDDCLQF